MLRLLEFKRGLLGSRAEGLGGWGELLGCDWDLRFLGFRAMRVWGSGFCAFLRVGFV